MYIDVYMYKNMYICMYVYSSVYQAYTCIYTYVCIYVHIYVCVYIHSSLYQASNRRKLTPPEIDKYEEQQHRIIRDYKGKKEQEEMRTRDAHHAVLRDKGTSILMHLVFATPGGGGLLGRGGG